ncbi:hypothetical protein [Ralstonia solanacearum]|uniref:Uncharacterized protein n=1 Tax=Ralstonia solanacearum TaxID=305 RepID=A0AAD0WGN7_RALSL|nr:hypothetical protein [Ralstonia solanacearum]AXV82280.1 hypothetical protein CJO77_12550 [Ralstonia solanacearum]AXW53407.1 hypothetical protein CJO92_12550 [Ralstonia solanacearum]
MAEDGLILQHPRRFNAWNLAMPARWQHDPMHGDRARCAFNPDGWLAIGGGHTQCNRVFSCMEPVFRMFMDERGTTRSYTGALLSSFCRIYDPMRTHRAADYCNSTFPALPHTITVIGDLRFLIEPSGNRHVSDPRAVADDNADKNIGTADPLRGMTLARLLSSDDDEPDRRPARRLRARLPAATVVAASATRASRPHR